MGTLVLAGATFASVRSANRAGRNAERVLQVGLRPVLFASRSHEAVQTIRWGDGHWAALAPGRAVLEEQDGIIYLALSLQNVGAGIAVLLGWRVDTFEILNPHASFNEMRAAPLLVRPDPATFRPQTQDQFSPPGDVSYWGAAIRTPDDPDRPRVEAALIGPNPLIVDLLYGDHEGGQRTISRFSIARYPGNDDEWVPKVGQHWYLDRDDPR